MARPLEAIEGSWIILATIEFGRSWCLNTPSIVIVTDAPTTPIVHVADGWVARNYDQLQLRESQEMKDDRAYLEAVARDLRAHGLNVTTHLALGDPPNEILNTANQQRCDLIAMTTHGHRLLGDIILGSTIEKVRHRSTIPLLIVRASA